jgi:hypothetical protein
MGLTRKAGIGLAAAMGLVISVPAFAQNPGQAALSDINKATSTLSQIQALGQSIEARHQSEATGTTVTATTTTTANAASSDSAKGKKKGKGAANKGKGTNKGKKKKTNP